jgi:hypothetical protein
MVEDVLWSSMRWQDLGRRTNMPNSSNVVSLASTSGTDIKRIHASAVEVGGVVT